MACAVLITLLVTDAAAGLQEIELTTEPELPSGVTPNDWSSIRDSISAHRHAFEFTHNGFEASSPRFDWRALFDGTSALIRPAAGDWSFGFALRAFGFEGQLQEVESPTFGACAEGQRITYGWTEQISEWWINDMRGFEHGFTVHARPARLAASDASPLVFELDVLGSLSPRVNEARTGLSLYDEAGATMLRYDGLVAFDANGEPLSAWLEVNGRSVRICVDERLAVYPIVVDPVIQEAYIKASNTDALDYFSRSLAASGDTVVVGAVGEDSSATGIDGNQVDNSAGLSGAAYVFVRSGSSWTQTAYLKASNTDTSDQFGISVAISGDTIVVGADREDSSATGVNGDQSSNAAADTGAAYVFVRSGSTWTQEAYLKASNPGESDLFGESVAVSGDTIVVGAPGEDSAAVNIDGNQSSNTAPAAGAAYVFVRSGSTWTQAAYLKAFNTNAGDQFGDAVAASGNTIVVGARGQDSGGSNSGAAYVFGSSGSSWIQQAYLKASNRDAGDRFGASVATSGDLIVVGAAYEGSSATGVDGDQSINSSFFSGAAYIFGRSGSSWTQEAYLKASNTDGGDEFGSSVAASGDTIVVGARHEDSSSTVINGNQLDNLASDSGAAYVFIRYGCTWIQDAYVKATNTGNFDEFGTSVAVSGGIVAVGAVDEASSGTGINGNQLNNSSFSTGAVYTFVRDGTTGGVGTPYCMAVSNSTGAAGELAAGCSVSVAENSLILVATGLPVSSFGFYFTSTSQGFAANPGGSDGNLCLSGLIGRYVGPGQIQQSDASGSFSLLLDLTNTPQPNGAVSINAGETWNFQTWYRDTNAMGATSNFTNGLEVLFTM